MLLGVAVRPRKGESKRPSRGAAFATVSYLGPASAGRYALFLSSLADLVGGGSVSPSLFAASSVMPQNDCTYFGLYPFSLSLV